MVRITKESIEQALREKVITKREAHELLLAMSRPKGKRIVRRQGAVGPIRH
jgi:hypothetical protein